MSDRCPICRKPSEKSSEYHPGCSRRFFGSYPPPAMELTIGNLREYAAKSVFARISVPGVQKKLSLTVEGCGRDSRFTIVGLWGHFILKPPVEEYPFLPENEDIVMHLASSVGIPVVPHALIRLASGELAYISRRVDRADGNEKKAMEDFCQISERLTEDKYKGSVERLGRLVKRHSVYPGLDAIDFFERLIFCFVVGNADMHLKNYSLLETPAGMRLSPAYDLVSTMLVIPDDPEESALTVNGKKSRLEKLDFNSVADHLEISAAARNKVYTRLVGNMREMREIVETSRLPFEQRKRLVEVIESRLLGTLATHDR